jgi:hypothetical protein
MKITEERSTCSLPGGWPGFGVMRSILLVVEGMSFRKHAFMRNAGHQNARGFAPEEDDVCADLSAIKTAPDILASAARDGIVGEIPTAFFQLVDITNGLSFAPGTQRVRANA